MDPTSNNSYKNYFNLDNDTEMEILGPNLPEPEKVKDVEEKKKTEPVEDSKKKPENENDKLTKKGSQKDWITIVVTTAAVAMSVFALLAASYLMASIFTGGLTLLGIIVPLSLAVGGFAGSILTLSLLKKITHVLDEAFTKLIEFFKKKPPTPTPTPTPEQEQV